MPEVWSVNLVEHRVEVYDGRPLRAHAVEPGQALRAAGLPDIALSGADLLEGR